MRIRRESLLPIVLVFFLDGSLAAQTLDRLEGLHQPESSHCSRFLTSRRFA